MTLSIRLKSITRIACIHKSHHASQKYPTMHYIFNRNVPTCSHCRLVLLPAVFPSSDKMYRRSDRGPVLVHIAVMKWCILGYRTGALWDFCNRHIYTSKARARCPQAKPWSKTSTRIWAFSREQLWEFFPEYVYFFFIFKNAHMLALNSKINWNEIN